MTGIPVHIVSVYLQLRDNPQTEWRCASGHIWKTSYHDIKGGNGCPYCGGKAHKTATDYHMAAFTLGYTWLGVEVPLGTKTKTLWCCHRGHEFNLPPALNAVMQRALAKTPDKRYQTATSFYEAFCDAVQGTSVPRTHLAETLLSAREQSVAETLKLRGNTTPSTLTFLFTDIEGSTQLWEQNPKAMSLALAHHDAVMAETIQAHEGSIADQSCGIDTQARSCACA